MTKLLIEKIGTDFYLTVDGKPSSFTKDVSDLLTIGVRSATNTHGIFTRDSTVVKFHREDGVWLNVDFESEFIEKLEDDPVAEINRRVKLVRDTFAKAEAEKEVWEGEIGVEPLETRWVLRVDVSEDEDPCDWAIARNTPKNGYKTRDEAEAELRLRLLPRSGQLYGIVEVLSYPEEACTNTNTLGARWVLEWQDTRLYPYTDWISCDRGRYATKAAAELRISTLAWDGRLYRAVECLGEIGFSRVLK